MNHLKTRRNLLVLLALLFVLHLVFILLQMYWFISWLDVPMHVAGAFLATLLALSFGGSGRKTLMYVLSVAILIGIVWELFELGSGITHFYSRRYVSDTLGDIGSDILGGVVTYMYLTFYIPWLKN